MAVRWWPSAASPALHAEQEALRSRCAVVLGFHLERQHDVAECRDTEEGNGVAGDHRRALDAATSRRHLAGVGARASREIIAAALCTRASPLNGTQETASRSKAGSRNPHALITHLSEVRKMGPEGESLPLLLDDPFINLDPSVKPALLELLSRSAGSPQVIFLTNDPDVCTWARLEALTGEIGILEAAPSTEESSDSVDFSAQS
jgi:hypothetical protein